MIQSVYLISVLEGTIYSIPLFLLILWLVGRKSDLHKTLIMGNVVILAVSLLMYVFVVTNYPTNLMGIINWWIMRVVGAMIASLIYWIARVRKITTNPHNETVKKGSFRLKNTLMIVSVVLLMVACWFYWFQYRPSQITKYCNKWADDSSGLTANREKWGWSNTEAYNGFYTQCLSEQGLK